MMPIMNTPITFFPANDIVVIGTNPECADFDNPRGELFGHAGFVIAEDELGNRVRWHVGTSRSEAEIMAIAERQANALIARLASGKLPVAFNTWQETFPAYGSDAYREEDTIEWERSLEH